MILFNSLAQYIADSFGCDPEFTKTMLFRTMVGVPATICFYFPLAMKREIGALAWGGLASIFALIYVTIIMTVEAPAYFH